MVTILETVGRATKHLLAETGKLLLFSVASVRCIVSRLPNYEALIEQMVEIGVGSALVIICVAVFVGMNITLQGYYIFKHFGGQSQVGIFVALSVVREMSPIASAAMVAAKAGSGMAARLATMRVKEQIDAIEVIGVNPIWLLVTPRLIATVLVLPLLVTVSNLFGLLSGFCVAVFQLKINAGIYVANILQYVKVVDLWNGIIKGAVLGFVLSVISCYYGYNASSGAEGVGSATNRAVVVSCVVGVITNYLLSEWMYG